MNKLYALLLACLFGAVSSPVLAQVVLEDFEGGTNDLVWNAIEGQFAGPVANPNTMNAVNTSNGVGRYTKDSTKAYSLFLAEFASPIQLTPNTNQVFVDIYASEDTRVIVKFEGTGPAIERIVNIPVANEWRRYRFDFSSAAAATTFTKVILFFDAGNEMGKGVYHFDNLTLGTDACAGVAPDPTIFDDFNCQRAPIKVGFDAVAIVENPDPDAVNGPGKVGKYTDPEGSFTPLLYNYDEPIGLATKPVLKIKYWAPIANRLLVKLENGTAPNREIGVDVTVTNAWQEYTFDFSDFAAGNYRSLVIFINAGQEAAGVIYYLDDIRLEEKQVVFLDDFEAATTNLFWQPKNNNAAVNGTFSVIANPSKTGLNLTNRTGAHTKGSSALSTLVALAAEPVDLSATPQVNMLVWAPAGSTTVRLSAISASQGRIDIDRDITATMEWVEVGFNFADFAEADDVSSFELVFDPALTGARTYYFDQISLGTSTVDPCEGTEVQPRIVDDFECQRNAEVTVGADRYVVVNNPDFTGNPSEKVGKYTHDGQQFSIVVYDLTGNEPDLAVFNNVVIDLWAPRAAPMLLKFEDSSNGAPNIEVPFNVTTPMAWKTYRVNFAAAAAGRYKKLVLFFNFAQSPGGAGDVYYVDNIRFARGPVTACATDFETANTTLDPWRGFAGGSVGDDDAFNIIDNPGRSGINTSAKVGEFIESGDGESFQGIYVQIGAPVLFPDAANKTIRAKVWSPAVVDVVMKLEGSTTGAPGTGDIFPVSKYSTPGQWQELTWDFSAFDTDGAQFQQITLIPGIGEVPAATRSIYFDDIVIGSAMCGSVGTRDEREAIVGMRAFPNPSAGELMVEVPAHTAQLQVIDALGRMVARIASSTSEEGGLQRLSLNEQPKGFYTVVALDAQGAALARVRLAIAE